MNVYEASKIVKEHFEATLNPSTVTTIAYYGYYKGEILKFSSENQAIQLNNGEGWIFKCILNNGEVDVAPIGY
jgi:hypothetical protein